ncbi:MAG: DEAD/DEAH box helicase [Rhodospirillaceae bacterium]|nr:DEAD/DEAH box helicase [Rhodospirillaceae bacterium]
MTFDDLGLSPDTLKAVTDAGYQTPTPIQEQAIPLVLMGRDVMGIAQTGTGKTAGFTLPMIDILAEGRAKARMPRSLIIAPTRELAAQVSDNFVKYGKYHPLSMALLIGGESMQEQEKVLDRGVDVLIATPGRLLDLFERGRIILNDVKILVIDEADRMLDMGFIPDVERIVSLLPKIRQTLFFSATMNPEIRRLADKFLMNPKEVQATAPATTATTIVQAIITVRPEDKRECLRRLIRAENLENAFIFCNRKRDVDIVFKSLIKHGFNAVGLHGDMPQPKRMEMLAKFKTGEADLLVCSDVAARGLDISGVSHVINFDVPFNSEDYVHRIGRTGRAGKQGHAVTIATHHDAKSVAAIERLIKQTIPPLVEPAVEDLKVGASSAPSEDGEGRERGGRGGRGRGRDRSERGGRSRGRDRHREERPAREAEPAAVAAVEQTAPTPAPEQSREQSRAQEHQSDNDRPPRKSRDREHRRGREHRDKWARDAGLMDHDDDVVGFGSAIPAFLQTAPPRPAAPAEPTPTNEEE